MKRWREWRQARELRRRAVAYLRTLETLPDEGEVRWLAAHGTGGDADHAQWELRYAALSLGLLTAERDALDDRTASVVAREMEDLFTRDTRVAPERRQVAQRQLNTRIRSYKAALGSRHEPVPTRVRLGQALLAFAGRPQEVQRPEESARAGDILARYLIAANQSLQAQFGAASLPEHLPPSSVPGGAV